MKHLKKFYLIQEDQEVSDLNTQYKQFKERVKEELGIDRDQSDSFFVGTLDRLIKKKLDLFNLKDYPSIMKEILRMGEDVALERVIEGEDFDNNITINGEEYTFVSRPSISHTVPADSQDGKMILIKDHEVLVLTPKS